ncbi:hypothetical protein C8R44DRAFT_875754 [Mycena epipterygia]|nr:hypothetical protein C8R44DRAFT_875754 [Mycena epipterygia]
MDSLHLASNGLPPRVRTKALDETDIGSLDWVGLNGNVDLIHDDALLYLDDTSYLDSTTFLDEFGLRLSIDWARDTDWYRTEQHHRGWIPKFPSTCENLAWWQALWRKVGTEQIENGRWRIPEDEVTRVQGDLQDFRNALEAIAEHPKFDLFIWSPPLFDVESLSETFESEAETASVADWRSGVPEPFITLITDLECEDVPKGGHLFSPNRDWKEINLTLIIRNDLPLFYVWGLFEQQDKRFSSLDP